MKDHNGEDRGITAEGMRRDFGELHAVDGVDPLMTARGCSCCSQSC